MPDNKKVDLSVFDEPANHVNKAVDLSVFDTESKEESAPIVSAVIPKTDVRTKVHDVLLSKASEDFKQNPLFQDSNPNAKKNKEAYINHLASKGYDKANLYNVSDQVIADTGGDNNIKTPENYKSISENQWGILQPIASWSNDFADKTVQSVAQGGKKIAKGAIDYETGQPLKGGLEMATGSTQVAFNVIPAAIAFNAGTDAIKTIANKNLSKENAEKVSYAMDVPFSMTTKIASKLGYNPEEGSIGQMLLELWDFVAAAGAFKAGGKFKEQIKSAKDLQEISKKVAENTATPEENLEFNKFVEVIPTVTVEDIQKVAEQHDTPIAKKIVADINEVKPPEQKVSPELENLQSQKEQLQSAVVSDAIKPVIENQIGEIDKAIDKEADIHSEIDHNEAKKVVEVNDIDENIKSAESDLKANEGLPEVAKLIQSQIDGLKTEREKIVPKVEEPVVEAPKTEEIKPIEETPKVEEVEPIVEQPKVIEPYEKGSKDYSKGKTSEDIAAEQKVEFTSPEEAQRHIAENSENPLELATNYLDIEKPSTNDYKGQQIEDYGIKMTDAEFDKYYDKNNKNFTLAKKYIDNKSDVPLDTQLQELSEMAGVEITPKDLFEHIDKTELERNSPTESDIKTKFKQQFEKLTDKNLTPKLANEIVNSELKRLTKNHEDAINKEYFNRAEAERGLQESIDKGETTINEVGEIFNTPKVGAEKIEGANGEVKVEKTSSIEPPVTPKKGDKVNYDDPEMTKMANAINDSFIEGKFGTEAMDAIINQLQGTDLAKIYDVVKEKIKKGLIDVAEVRKRLLETKTGSEQDQAALLYDMAELKGKERELTKSIIEETDNTKKQKLQANLLEVQNSMMDNTLANRHIGRSASTVFRIRQVWADKDANLSNMIDQYKASKGIKELSKEQEAEVTKMYTKLRELETTIRDLEAMAKESVGREETLLKENEILKKLKDSAKEQKRVDRGIKADRAIDKSKARIQKSKDKLRELRGTLSAGINPEIAVEISKIAAEHVYQGVVKVDVLVKNVLEDIKDIFPDFTEKDVKAHLEYTKEGKPQSEQSKIKKVIKKTFQIEGKTERGEYEPTKRRVYEESEALKEAKKQYAIERFKWEVDRRQDMLKNRPLGHKIADSMIRWQRFAVLSYPSTLIKLAAVVGHGLILKPFQFATQSLLNKILPKGVTGKADMWGKPSVKALGKYYSEFIRNFALSNLKEHFTGVDAKEAQYGKPFIYDEWSLGQGILEMPGRSHGYIKSFIKSPEFKYAHTQIIESYIGKMAEIERQLKNPDLSAAEKTKLENEYKAYDVTNEDVVMRANKLALEHGKWAILMNDSKGVDALKRLLNDKSFGGYLLKTELPIVKIPFNFIGRAFNTKYGILRALMGKHDVISGEHSKGLVEIMTKGTKDLKPEEADLIGRSLTIGTMGASLFALGYMNHKNIKHEKDDSWTINGVNVGKNLLHVPVYESLISGAETAHSMDRKGQEGGYDWIKNFIESDIHTVKNNPFFSMLQYGFTGNLMTAMFRTKNADQMENKISDAVNQKIANMLIPGVVKQTAQHLDTKEAGLHPYLAPIQRRPKGGGLEKFLQEIELGIPVLRKNVPKYRGHK